MCDDTFQKNTKSNKDSSYSFDIANFPLYGHRLIEAGAGTGKTYTIANLYLRLVTGHGTANTKVFRPLLPKEILVVTFTEAATQELKDRIAARIQTAHSIFSKQITIDEHKLLLESDPFLKQLFFDIQDHDHVSFLLNRAKLQMDEASIFTIHGFCLQMLKQYAFESHINFNTQISTDTHTLLEHATLDFWRSEFYDLSASTIKKINTYWKSPYGLIDEIKPLFSKNIDSILSFDKLDYKTRKTLIEKQINKIKALWLEDPKNIFTIIQNSDVSKKSYSKKHLPVWCEIVTKWANSNKTTPPDKIAKFSAKELHSKTEKGEPPKHQIFNEIEKYLLLPKTFKDIFFVNALTKIKKNFQNLKLNDQVFDFDDLLKEFSTAISAKDNQLLRNQISTALPIAIIDEFQDTDVLQYKIFKNLYTCNNRNSGFFMIGDPKQAIYAFRGADIFTYIKASRATQEKYTLTVNWRSTSNMIAACNHIFTLADSPFIYDQDIPYHRVLPSPNANNHSLYVNKKKSAAVYLWAQPDNDNKPESISNYYDFMTNTTVNEIAKLLTLGQDGLCTIINKKNNSKRNVNSNDIAILVRKNTEAEQMQKALTNANIKSVYMSEKNSVFISAIAKDIYYILSACLAPNQETTVRTALATSIINHKVSYLDELKQNQILWQQIVDDFNHYNEFWKKNGVLALIRYLLTNKNIFSGLTIGNHAQRNITDLLHLGEILSSQEIGTKNRQDLIDWLWHNIHELQNNSSYQLNLESDQNPVKIITMHKSKGLEYSIVFMPFICAYQPIKKQNNPDKLTGYSYHNENDTESILDLTCSEKSYNQAEKERLAEDIRLLYVGITRSIYCCYLGVGPIKKGIISAKQKETELNKTAIGYLLHQSKKINANELESILTQKWQHENVIQVLSPNKNEITTALNESHNLKKSTLYTKSFTQDIERNWKVTSYTELSQINNHEPMLNTLPLNYWEIEPDNYQKSLTSETEKNIFTFPKGAQSGIFLHSLFENINFKNAALTPPTDKIKKQLAAYNFSEEWLHTIELVINKTLTQPLIDTHTNDIFSLTCIDNFNKYTEMEFCFPISELSSQKLNSIICEYDTLSKNAQKLSFNNIKGMLKGFIDLVFVHKNRYYIIDYKSNFMGDNYISYDQISMANTMKEHRYDLQYQLYVLAIHRLLKLRLPEYSYEKNMGGVFYLFLRGIQGDCNPDNITSNGNGTGVFYFKPQYHCINKLDKLFYGKE